MNGVRTKGENIADNGGLKHSFLAFQRAQHTAKRIRLPGVRFSDEQLFFLSYAQIWCGQMNAQEAIRKLRTSEHSPGPIRVKGPLSNSAEFARAFECAPGAGMHPAKKCTVW